MLSFKAIKKLFDSTMHISILTSLILNLSTCRKELLFLESQQKFGTCYSVLALPDIVLGDYRISLNCHTTKALTRQEGPNEF